MLARIPGSTVKGVILLIIRFWAETSKQSLDSKHLWLFSSVVTLWDFPNSSNTPEHFDGEGIVCQNSIARVHILTVLPSARKDFTTTPPDGFDQLVLPTQCWRLHQNLLNRVGDGFHLLLVDGPDVVRHHLPHPCSQLPFHPTLKVCGREMLSRAVKLGWGTGLLCDHDQSDSEKRKR